MKWPDQYDLASSGSLEVLQLQVYVSLNTSVNPCSYVLAHVLKILNVKVVIQSIFNF